MTSDLTTEERLLNYVFRVQNKRRPEIWELILGLAIVDGTIRVQQVPGAPELRRVYYAAAGVRAALGLLAPTPNPSPKGRGEINARK